MSSSSKKGDSGVTAEAKRFLFDTHDFNLLKSAVDACIYTEEHLALAKNQSFSLGRAEGLKEARQQQEERIAELLQKVLTLTEKLGLTEDRREMEKCVEAAKMALRITHKLMPQFAARHALPEIERVILQSIQARREEPRIAVTVPTAHLDALKARVDALAVENAYAGKIILIADDALPPTDCRVEWADGGAERLYERLFAQIDNEFTKATAGMAALIEQDKK